MYLFDTDTITGIFKPAASPRLQGKLREVPAEQQFISTITIYEIVYGAYMSARTDHHQRNLKELPPADLQVASIAIANELVLVTGNVGRFQRIPGLPVQNWM